MLLTCSKLSFQFPRAENPLFNGLSCSLSLPGFHGLFGLSGVGKSTLAKIIAGELNGFTGKISTDNLHTILYSNNLEKLQNPVFYTSYKVRLKIFRGRYKAILVQQDEYLHHLSRYLHLNPVRAQLVKDPADYQWSSYK